jgi:hypothetical protein
MIIVRENRSGLLLVVLILVLAGNVRQVIQMDRIIRAPERESIFE